MNDKMKRMIERLSDLDLDRIIGLAEADLGTLDSEQDSSEVGRYLRARKGELEAIRYERFHQRFSSTVDGIKEQYTEGAITLREACAALVARLTVLYHELPEDTLDEPVPSWTHLDTGVEAAQELITVAAVADQVKAVKKIKF